MTSIEEHCGKFATYTGMTITNSKRITYVIQAGARLI